jgi:hypothetical protein
MIKPRCGDGRTIGDMPQTLALVGDLEWLVAGPVRGQFAVCLCATSDFD